MFACYLFFSFVLGCIVGSTGLCLCERVMEGKDWFLGRSRCDHCDHILGAKDLIPLVSYLLQKGKCRYCHCRISKKYPAVECLMGCLFLLTAFVYKDEYILTFRDWGLYTLLLCISLIDLKQYVISDVCVVLGIAWFFECAFLKKDADMIVNGVVFACVMLFVLTVLTVLMEKIKHQECLGGGDLKLLFMAGLYLGFPLGIFALLFSCMFAGGMMLLKKKKMLAFAPYISAGVMITLLFKEQILLYCGWFWI